jgi:hypothetical protein
MHCIEFDSTKAHCEKVVDRDGNVFITIDQGHDTNTHAVDVLKKLAPIATKIINSKNKQLSIKDIEIKICADSLNERYLLVAYFPSYSDSGDLFPFTEVDEYQSEIKRLYKQAVNLVSVAFSQTEDENAEIKISFEELAAQNAPGNSFCSSLSEVKKLAKYKSVMFDGISSQELASLPDIEMYKLESIQRLFPGKGFHNAVIDCHVKSIKANLIEMTFPKSLKAPRTTLDLSVSKFAEVLGMPVKQVQVRCLDFLGTDFVLRIEVTNRGLDLLNSDKPIGAFEEFYRVVFPDNSQSQQDLCLM